MHPHLYELDQVNVSIQHNHRDSKRAEQIRTIQGTQPDGITPLTMRLRAAITATMTTIGIHLRHQPTVSQESVT